MAKQSDPLRDPSSSGMVSPTTASAATWSPTKGAASTYIHYLPYVDLVWRALQPGCDLSGARAALAVACDGPSHCSGFACKVCAAMTAATAAAASYTSAGDGDDMSVGGSLPLTTAIASAYDYVVLVGDVNVRLDTTDTARVQTALTSSPMQINSLLEIDQMRQAVKAGGAYCVLADMPGTTSGGGASKASPSLPSSSSPSDACGPSACGDSEAVEYLRRFVAASDLAAATSAEGVHVTVAPRGGLVAFCEPPVLFRPSYKYIDASPQYDYTSKKGIPRIPSWTDRIMMLARKASPSAALPGDEVPSRRLAPAALCSSYRCVQSVLTSDHRPVIAQIIAGGIEVDHSAVMRVLHAVALRKEGASVGGLAYSGRGDSAPHVTRTRMYD